jgi:hypothetical protein
MKVRLLVCVGLTLLPGGVVAQRLDPPGCLHNENETAAERARREEALMAMWMIDGILRTFPSLRLPPPSWEDVSESSAVRRLRSQGNELAWKIRWGAREPLPGWRIEWGTGRNVAFALIDVRDPCGFAYSSDDEKVGLRYRLQLLS